MYSRFSAIFCTTGEQAAKRAKEGFDMVSCSRCMMLAVGRLSDWMVQINVTTDTGAMTQAISNHLSAAVGS